MQPGGPVQMGNMQAMGGMFAGPFGDNAEEEEDELSPDAREVHTNILQHIRAGQDDDDLVTALLSAIPKAERAQLIHADWEQLLRDIAVHGNVRILELLLSQGGDVDWEAGADDDSIAMDPNGEHAQMNTIWGRACRSGQKEVLRVLQSRYDMSSLTVGAPNQGALEAGHRSRDGIVSILMNAPVKFRPDPLEIEYAGGPVIAAPAAGGCLGDLREMMAWAAPTVTKAYSAQRCAQAMAGAAAAAVQKKHEAVLQELLCAEAPFTPKLNLATEHYGSCLSALAQHSQATDAETRILACRMVLQLARASPPPGSEFEWSATRDCLQAGLMGAPVDAEAHLEFMDSGPGHHAMQIGRHETPLTRAAASGDAGGAAAALGSHGVPCADSELGAALAAMHVQEAFIAAAQGGHVHVCAALVASAAFAEAGGLLPDTAHTALALACGSGASDTAKWLLRNTAASPVAFAQLAFRLACRRGHAECVKALLQADGTPIDPSEGGEEAFIGACAGGHTHVAELLLKQAAGAGRTLCAGAKGNSALLWAAWGGHGECVRLLLQLPTQHGVDIAQDDGVVLLAAMGSGCADTVVQLLQARAEWSSSLIQEAAVAATTAQASACLQVLLDSPASKDMDLGADQQALFKAACAGGSVDIVEMLAAMGSRGVQPWYEPPPPPQSTFGGRQLMMIPRAHGRGGGRNMPAFQAACAQAHWPVVQRMLSWSEGALACPARGDAVTEVHAALVPESLVVYVSADRWLHYVLHVLSMTGEDVAPVEAVGALLQRCLHWLNSSSQLDEAACMGVSAAVAALAPYTGPCMLQRMLPGAFPFAAFSKAALQRVEAAGGIQAAVQPLLNSQHGAQPTMFPGFSSHPYLPLLLLVRHVASAKCSGVWMNLPLLLASALQEWGVASEAADIAAGKHGTDEQLREYLTGEARAFSGVWASFCTAVRGCRWWYSRLPILHRSRGQRIPGSGQSESKRR